MSSFLLTCTTSPQTLKNGNMRFGNVSARSHNWLFSIEDHISCTVLNFIHTHFRKHYEQGALLFLNGNVARRPYWHTHNFNFIALEPFFCSFCSVDSSIFFLENVYIRIYKNIYVQGKWILFGLPNLLILLFKLKWEKVALWFDIHFHPLHSRWIKYSTKKNNKITFTQHSHYNN